MAEKPEVNKSEAIRDVFKSNPNAKAQEVVDALAKKGITVTVSLVHTVKSKHNQRQAAKKAARKATQHPVAEAKTTDKKPEVNKSQAIREYVKANPKATTQEVVDALKKQGIETTANYVSNMRATRKKRRKAVKQAVAAAVPAGGVGIPQVKAALAFLKAVGGDAIAKQALAAAIEIKKIV